MASGASAFASMSAVADITPSAHPPNLASKALCSNFPDYLRTKSSSRRLTHTGGRGVEFILLYLVVIHSSPGLRSKMYGYAMYAPLSRPRANTTGFVHVLASSSEKAMDSSLLCQLAITSESTPARLGKLFSPSGYSRFHTSTNRPLDRFNR